MNSIMITVLDEICEMVDHTTGFGTFTAVQIVGRISIKPLTLDEVCLGIKFLLEDGCVVGHGNDLYQVPAAPAWTQLWRQS